jgi:predicted DNA-binding transcriptional regulator AlpA
MNESEFLNKKQVQKFFGISRDMLDGLMLRHEIPFMRMGPRLIKFRLRDFEKYIASRTTPQPSSK